MKNPDLPTFSGEIPTPKGEVEYDNFGFQLQMLRSSYTDDAIRNVIVASERTHAKIAIRAIGYGSSLDAMIRQLENRFGLGETVDILGQQFHQLMQQPKERVGEFGGNLEYKFRLLQEKCPGRFHGMSDKLSNSVWFLYSQPGCDFNTLLKAAMTCENEAISRASTRAKSMQVDTNENAEVAKTGISSIRKQLDQMNAILKGANFKSNNGYKKCDKQDIRNKLKGPGISAAGPFRKGKKPVQCYHCNGWGHYKLQCPNEEPVQGSKEWENLHGESPFPGTGSQSPTVTTVTSKMGTTGGGSLREMLKMPEYHSPDPLVRLIGEANEAPAIVVGVSITSLVDSGACMSAMVKSFAEELQLEIKPLKMILDIQATGDGAVPYHGYVECRLQLPQIKKFDVDVLMLVIDDSAYGMHVPIQIGTLHIDMALELATEAEMKKLSRKWDQAKMATALHMNSMVVSEEPKFKLDDVQGSVHTTQKMMLGLFESITVSGILKGPVKNSAYHKCVNVSVEPLETHKEVMIKNLTARAIKVLLIRK